MKFLRVVLAIVLASIGAAQAQLLEEVWRTYSDLYRSNYRTPTFASGNRVVMVENYGNSGEERIVCVDSRGARLWTYDLVRDQDTLRILATSDDRVYITTGWNENGLIVLDMTGNLLWTYSIPDHIDFRLLDCRIFGDNLLVVGTGRAVNLAASPRTILVSLNRFSGAENYKREYLINNAAFLGTHELRSAGGYAFIIANRYPSGTGVLKVDPATGDPVASYTTAPFTVQYTELDSTGQVYLSGDSNPTIGGTTELRKVNGSGLGAMNMVYRVNGLIGQMALSKGFLYQSSWPSLLKIRPSDGVVLWTKDPGMNGAFGDVRADAYGRLYTTKVDYSNNFNRAWVNLFEPNTGADLELVPILDEGSETGVSGNFGLNSYGEVVFAGGFNPGQLDASAVAVQFFSPQEPVNDVYNVAQGEKLITNGNGVLANDRYTNPTATFVSKVSNSGPTKGRLTLSANGEFQYEAKHLGNLVPPGPQTFRYRSVRQGITREADVTINVTRGLISFTLARYTLAGDATVSGKVVISSSGPATTVALSDNSDFVTLPAIVNIPANSVLGTFIVEAQEVPSSIVVTLTARYETTTRTINLTLNNIAVSTAVCSHHVTGGTNGGLDVGLNGPASPGGVDVVLFEDSPYISLPPTLHVFEGETLGTAVIQTVPVNYERYVPMTGSYGGQSRTCYIRVRP